MQTIFIIVGLIVIYKIISKIISFKKELKNDRIELEQKSIQEKFSIVINGLNSYCYNGQGVVKIRDKYTVSLYKEDSCQILFFTYSTGTFNVIWKFKYYQNEMIFERSFGGSQNRNPSDEDLQSTLETIKEEFYEEYLTHKNKVDRLDFQRSDFDAPSEIPFNPNLTSNT